MGHQRFLLRQFQFEFFAENCSESLFDRFCLCFGANECYCKVISVSALLESSVVGVLGVNGGKFLSLLFDLLGSLLLSSAPSFLLRTALFLEKLLWGFRRHQTRVWQAIPH